MINAFTQLRLRPSRTVRAVVLVVGVASAVGLLAVPVPAVAGSYPPPYFPPGFPAPNPSAYDTTAERTHDVPFAVLTESLLPGQTAGGLLQPATAANAKYWCTQRNWNPIQGVANGLTIGNCGNTTDWYVGATVLAYAPSSVPGQGPYYWGGYISQPDYNSCGYVNNDRVTYSGSPNPTPSSCTSPDRTNKADYVYCSVSSPCGGPNGESTNLDIWTSPDGNTGVPITPMYPCVEYANYRPWSSNGYERDPTGVTAQTTQSVLLRYLAKYPSTDGTGYYAMIQDQSSPSSQWVFVRWTCLVGP